MSKPWMFLEVKQNYFGVKFVFEFEEKLSYTLQKYHTKTGIC